MLKKTDNKPRPASLTRRLSDQIQSAGAEALKADPALAVSALIAWFSSGSIIKSRDKDTPNRSSDFSEVLTAAMKSTPEQRMAMLVQIAAQAFVIDDCAPALFKAMGPNVLGEAVLSSMSSTVPDNEPVEDGEEMPEDEQVKLAETAPKDQPAAPTKRKGRPPGAKNKAAKTPAEQ